MGEQASEPVQFRPGVNTRIKSLANAMLLGEVAGSDPQALDCESPDLILLPSGQLVGNQVRYPIEGNGQLPERVIDHRG